MAWRGVYLPLLIPNTDELQLVIMPLDSLFCHGRRIPLKGCVPRSTSEAFFLNKDSVYIFLLLSFLRLRVSKVETFLN